MDSSLYKDSLILLEACVIVISLLILDSLSNNETFMTTNIHSLQGFHIHYIMYVVAMRLVILLLFFFFYFTRFPYSKGRL
jgi:uncharacterized membrane protein YobD (UPF0266 family)